MTIRNEEGEEDKIASEPETKPKTPALWADHGGMNMAAQLTSPFS